MHWERGIASEFRRLSVTEILNPETGLVGPALNSWFDSEPSGLAIGILFLSFVLIWTGFQIISYASIDLHPDLLEVYAWGLHPSAGYYKHPPLAGLMAGAWFWLFPAADWSFHLLAMTNAAIGLYVTYLIGRRFLKGDSRMLAVLLLLFTPFYQFHGQRFGANQTLISTWPIATYCFLRAFDTCNVPTRGSLWALLAGASAALAMLGKYYSIFLIVGFLAAVLVHSGHRTYLRSWSPWLSAAIGCIMLAPHVRWSFTSGFSPLIYAMAVHASSSLGEALWKDVLYTGGGVAYVSVLLAVFWFTVRPDRQTAREIMWPSDADGRMLITLLAVPLILPVFVAPVIGAVLTPLWTMSAWYLLPIVLLRPPTVTVGRRAAIGVAAMILANSLTVLLAAPVLAWFYHLNGTKEGREYYALVSDEITRDWHMTTGKTLKIVTGDLFLVSATTFYSADHPDSVPNFSLNAAPWVTSVRLEREGWAAICVTEARSCVDEGRRMAANKTGAAFIYYQAPNRFLGTQGKPGTYLFILVPPQ
jgi:4-amino-4-deoxy-L-arabinose transferase-like glycosyltransferase